MSQRVDNSLCSLYLQTITQSPGSNRHYFNYFLILIELGQAKLGLYICKIGEVYRNRHSGETQPQLKKQYVQEFNADK